MNTSVLDGSNCNIEKNLILASIPKLVFNLLDYKLAWLRPSISSDHVKARNPKRNLDFTENNHQQACKYFDTSTYVVRKN